MLGFLLQPFHHSSSPKHSQEGIAHFGAVADKFSASSHLGPGHGKKVAAQAKTAWDLGAVNPA